MKYFAGNSQHLLPLYAWWLYNISETKLFEGTFDEIDINDGEEDGHGMGIPGGDAAT